MPKIVRMRRLYGRQAAIASKWLSGRSTKKSRKSRFSKKRFYKKNNLNTLSIRPMVYARELYVKTKWTRLEQLTVPINNSIRRVFIGNSPTQIPGASQGALLTFGSISSSITAGEVYPGGFVEYGSFYDKYMILGSSINVVAHCVNTNSNIILRAVMIPIMPSPDGTTDSLEAMINQLDAYTFDQLMSYPQAQYRQVISASSGHAKFAFKFFRKTKNMFMVKDMKDEQDNFNCQMPDTAGAGGTRPQQTDLFGYYLRVFNSTGTSTLCETTTTMKHYVRFNQRRYVQAVTAT